jgi:hypothetical protein
VSNPDINALCAQLIAHRAKESDGEGRVRHFSIPSEHAQSILGEIVEWRSQARTLAYIAEKADRNKTRAARDEVPWGRSQAHMRVYSACHDAFREACELPTRLVGRAYLPPETIGHVADAIVRAMKQDLGDRWNAIEGEARALADENAQLRSLLDQVISHSNHCTRRLEALEKRGGA